MTTLGLNINSVPKIKDNAVSNSFYPILFFSPPLKDDSKKTLLRARKSDKYCDRYRNSWKIDNFKENNQGRRRIGILKINQRIFEAITL